MTANYQRTKCKSSETCGRKERQKSAWGRELGNLHKGSCFHIHRHLHSLVSSLWKLSVRTLPPSDTHNLLLLYSPQPDQVLVNVFTILLSAPSDSPRNPEKNSLEALFGSTSVLFPTAWFS